MTYSIAVDGISRDETRPQSPRRVLLQIFSSLRSIVLNVTFIIKGSRSHKMLGHVVSTISCSNAVFSRQTNSETREEREWETGEGR